MAVKVMITPRSFGVISDKPLEILRNKGYELIRNNTGRPLKAEEIIEMAADVDALLVGIDQVTAEVINKLPRLKVISKYGEGVDNIDLEAAAKRGIPVTNTPGVNTEAVADLAVGLMLCAARQIAAAHEATQEGLWKRFTGTSLYRKTVAVLGTGKIGRAVARRLKGFDVKFLFYDIAPDPDFAGEMGGKYAELEEIWQQADYISLNLPLLPSTRNLIGEEQLKSMKPNAILVNTARGGIIDEEALVKALQEGWIRGAALDAFSSEPLDNDELRTAPNLVLTPHIGAYTEEAITAMGMEAANNVIAVLEGRSPSNIVNQRLLQENDKAGVASH